MHEKEGKKKNQTGALENEKPHHEPGLWPTGAGTRGNWSPTKKENSVVHATEGFATSWEAHSLAKKEKTHVNLLFVVMND